MVDGFESVEQQSKQRLVYYEDKVLELPERVGSLDSFDNVALLFNDSGGLNPYEH